jgi:hypothetical protein
VQNFPAVHPYAPVPKGTAWQLGRLVPEMARGATCLQSAF